MRQSPKLAAIPALFVCPRCGLVSAYSKQDVKKGESPEQNGFLQGKLYLRYIEVGCDGYGCAFQPRIYLISTRPATPIGEEKDAFDAKQMKDWKLAEFARCGAGHGIVMNPEGRLYQAQSGESPF
ncbi:MAG: hypothetical protein ACRD2L_08895 [Terriglobia bacterium]